MTLQDLYNKSTSQHVAEAKKIPFTPPNYIDQNKQFLKEFTIQEKAMGVDDLTDAALNYYDTELSHLVRPQGFDPNTPLNQYNPTHPYEPAGAPKGQST